MFQWNHQQVHFHFQLRNWSVFSRDQATLYLAMSAHSLRNIHIAYATIAHSLRKMFLFSFICQIWYYDEWEETQRDSWAQCAYIHISGWPSKKKSHWTKNKKQGVSLPIKKYPKNEYIVKTFFFMSNQRPWPFFCYAPFENRFMITSSKNDLKKNVFQSRPKMENMGSLYP